MSAPHEERGVEVKMGWMVALLLTGAMYGQSVQSGRSVRAGAYSSQGQESGLSGPLTYAARTDMAVFGTGAEGELLPANCEGVPACLANAYNASATTGHQGAALSYTGSPTQAPPAAGTVVSGTNINGLGSYLAGYNMQVTDPDFGAVMIRATDVTLYDTINCLGSGNFGSSFSMGSGTNTLPWASDGSKLRIINSGGSATILAFNPATGVVSPSDLCGGYMPGAATFSGNNPDVLYTVNTGQENTVPFTSISGTFTTPETITQDTTGAQVTLLALNSTFAQVSPLTHGTADNTHNWRDSSGAYFVPNASYSGPGTNSTTPYANTIYKGVINDGGTPSTWTVAWLLVFEFNYLPAMAGDPHFPGGAGSCLPPNFDANFTGVFSVSTDDTEFTELFGDNGQQNHTGYNGGGSGSTYVCPNSPDGICQGPIYVANFRQGYGCRVYNSMTEQISGDWGPTGQVLNGQANLITGSVAGSPTAGDALTQDVTGATTQLTCLQNSSSQCVTTGWTKALTGLVYGTADSSHVWRDSNNGSANYLTPSASPVNAPFIFPDVLHESSQMKNAQLANISMVQKPEMKVTSISYNATTHQTTVLYNNDTTYSPGQQFSFRGLAGGHDAYLDCASANQCPVVTAVAIANTGDAVCPGNGPYCPSGSNGTITISDALGGGANYTDSESPASAALTPNSQMPGSTSGYSGENFWQTRTLIINPVLGDSGHHATGDHYVFKGKFYTAENQFNPSMPATIADMGSSNPACQMDGSPCGLVYPGPNTPPPNDNELRLLPFSIVDDQHGTWGHSGPDDLTPPAFITELVCGQAESGGVGGFLCPPQYASVWDAELVAVENWVTRSSPGNLVGADCDYGDGPAPCVYRVGHTFNTNDNWLFTGQNPVGASSRDGNWIAFPSDWNKTLGCMDRTTTNCWSSWQASAPTASGTGVSWSSDGATPPNATITMTNSFCPTGGTQYYWTDNTIQPVTCGTRAGTVKLTGFAESWLNNQTLALGPNTSNNWQCDSTDSNAGTCNKFVLAGVTGAPANSSGTESGTQKATPTACGNGVPCQRTDIWIAKISSAHQ